MAKKRQREIQTQEMFARLAQEKRKKPKKEKRRDKERADGDPQRDRSPDLAEGKSEETTTCCKSHSTPQKQHVSFSSQEEQDSRPNCLHIKWYGKRRTCHPLHRSVSPCKFSPEPDASPTPQSPETAPNSPPLSTKHYSSPSNIIPSRNPASNQATKSETGTSDSEDAYKENLETSSPYTKKSASHPKQLSAVFAYSSSSVSRSPKRTASKYRSSRRIESSPEEPRFLSIAKSESASSCELVFGQNFDPDPSGASRSPRSAQTSGGGLFLDSNSWCQTSSPEEPPPSPTPFSPSTREFSGKESLSDSEDGANDSDLDAARTTSQMNGEQSISSLEDKQLSPEPPSLEKIQSSEDSASLSPIKMNQTKWKTIRKLSSSSSEEEHVSPKSERSKAMPLSPPDKRKKKAPKTKVKTSQENKVKTSLFPATSDIPNKTRDPIDCKKTKKRRRISSSLEPLTPTEYSKTPSNTDIEFPKHSEKSSGENAEQPRLLTISPNSRRLDQCEKASPKPKEYIDIPKASPQHPGDTKKKPKNLKCKPSKKDQEKEKNEALQTSLEGKPVGTPLSEDIAVTGISKDFPELKTKKPKRSKCKAYQLVQQMYQRNESLQASLEPETVKISTDVPDASKDSTENIADAKNKSKPNKRKLDKDPFVQKYVSKKDESMQTSSVTELAEAPLSQEKDIPEVSKGSPELTSKTKKIKRSKCKPDKNKSPIRVKQVEKPISKDIDVSDSSKASQRIKEELKKKPKRSKCKADKVDQLVQQDVGAEKNESLQISLGAEPVETPTSDHTDVPDASKASSEDIADAKKEPEPQKRKLDEDTSAQQDVNKEDGFSSSSRVVEPIEALNSKYISVSSKSLPESPTKTKKKIKLAKCKPDKVDQFLQLDDVSTKNESLLTPSGTEQLDILFSENVNALEVPKAPEDNVETKKKPKRSKCTSDKANQLVQEDAGSDSSLPQPVDESKDISGYLLKRAALLTNYTIPKKSKKISSPLYQSSPLQSIPDVNTSYSAEPLQTKDGAKVKSNTLPSLPKETFQTYECFTVKPDSLQAKLPGIHPLGIWKSPFGMEQEIMPSPASIDTPKPVAVIQPMEPSQSSKISPRSKPSSISPCFVSSPQAPPLPLGAPPQPPPLPHIAPPLSLPQVAPPPLSHVAPPPSLPHVAPPHTLPHVPPPPPLPFQTLFRTPPPNFAPRQLPPTMYYHNVNFPATTYLVPNPYCSAQPPFYGGPQNWTQQ